LNAILEALDQSQEHVIWPVHPRCKLEHLNTQLINSARIHTIPPQGYPDFIALLRHARIVLTDSGGVQKEAYWLGIPCLTLRKETEWVETVSTGWNQLVGSDKSRITAGIASFKPTGKRPHLYGNGQAAQKILEVLSGWESDRRKQGL
jgi:UDP-N-acetylglucosamine 2-epimerase